MNFLLDTNVVSEWTKPVPEPRVVAWLAAADEDRLFLSAVSLAEIRFGVDLLPAGRRQARLNEWTTNALPARFGDRILPIDLAIAEACGGLSAKARREGLMLEAMDGFIAATAAVHGMTLVTRNVRDFDYLGIETFNPWVAL